MNSTTELLPLDIKNQRWASFRNKRENRLMLASVTGPDAYAHSTGQGMARAVHSLVDRGITQPTDRELQDVHLMIFADTMKAPGEFRQLGQMTTFRGHTGAESSQLAKELERTRLDTAEFMAKSNAVVSPQATLAGIAYDHSRRKKIQPFAYGNGKVDLVVLAAQMTRAFGEEAAASVGQAIERDPARYHEVLDKGLAGSDLAPLADFLGQEIGIEMPKEKVDGVEQPVSIPSPFRLSCRPVRIGEAPLPIEEERKLARTSAEIPAFEALTPEMFRSSVTMSR